MSNICHAGLVISVDSLRMYDMDYPLCLRRPEIFWITHQRGRHLMMHVTHAQQQQGHTVLLQVNLSLKAFQSYWT